MKYQIEIDNRAKREIKKLTLSVREKILAKIRTLVTNPRPDGIKKLSNHNALYRIRVGDYRIIYQIQDKKCIVLVVEVGHRKLIYKRLGK